MKFRGFIAGLLLLSTAAVAACSAVKPAATAADTDKAVTDMSGSYASMTPEEICASLTLEQKAAQMMQPTLYNVPPAKMKTIDYGSVLSRIDDWPMPTADEWKSTVNEYQKYAMESDAGIPYIYGNDSVHGVNFASGCVIFPHNINVGAANDAELTGEYGKLVGSDIVHTGMLLNFSPCVATACDPRWGRTYESYSSDSGRVTELAVAYTKGLLSEGIVVCPKHFFGDGMTSFGTGEDPDTMLIDRGDARLTEDQIKDQLAVYQALIDEGVQVIMLSHSSLNGVKMHENEKYISILKNDMGFNGIVLSDWDSIMNCSGATYKDNIILGVNAGIDMFMTETDHDAAMSYIVQGVNEGRISSERIDDAVTRIIRVKKDAGLFDDPFLEDLKPSYEYASQRSHEVARMLAAESFVPLKAGNHMYIEPGMKVFVTGPAADDVGALCGGWTNWWQGSTDEEFSGGAPSMHFVEGSSIVEALKEAGETNGFEIVTDKSQIGSCDMVILCIGEKPYAEWYGDTADMSVTGALGLSGNAEAIKTAADSGLPTVALITAGRNVIISEYLDKWDSCIMLYLPGSEGGNAAADVLTKKVEMTGTLPMPYYSSVDQINGSGCWKDTGWNAFKDTV
ncbi:MAG: glycoside hydrolase family 3 protein [Clostridiales bacterium]|nr:glycoside hydrolase family 3 protein [Clostridiales bacterium]